MPRRAGASDDRRPPDASVDAPAGRPDWARVTATLEPVPHRRRLHHGWWWALGAALGLPLLAALLLAGHLTQPFFRAHPPPTVLVDAERLRADVVAFATTFSPRGATDLANLDRLATYLADRLDAAKGRVSEHRFTYQGNTHRNVVASFGPMDGPRILVGAHYDAAGPHPGADDNASGLAGLLELARLLGDTPPAKRVDLVAYALEEEGLVGSEAHARALRGEGIEVTAMISMEMIGTFSDAADSQRFPLAPLKLLYPHTGNFIAVIGQLSDPALVRRVKSGMVGTPLAVRSINSPRFIPGIGASDHASFWDQGYPAVMVTDTAYLRNDRYHTAQDTPDTLDYARMAHVVTGVFGAVRALVAQD